MYLDVYNKKNNTCRKQLFTQFHFSLNAAGLALCSLWLQSPVALATQPPMPDPSGTLSREIEKQKEHLLEPELKKEIPAVKKEQEPEVAEEAGGPVLLLQGIRFTESRHLSREELQSLAAPWLGKEVNYQDLQTLLGAVKQLYRSKGIYTATAVFPEQKIENGLVSIRLVEGRFGELVLAGEVAEGDREYVQKWINTDWQKDSIDVEALERDILFYNRVHGQRLQSELKAGQAFGLTDVVVQIPQSEEGASLYFDNHGTESAGEEQLSLLYQKTSVLSHGDKLLGYGLASNGLKSFSASYNRVVGEDGWRLGGSFQYTDSELELTTLDVDVIGDTTRYTLDASHLLWSDINGWQNLLFSASSTRSENAVADEPLSDYRNDQLQFGQELNLLGDNWQVNGRVTFSKVRSKSILNDDESYLSLLSPRLTMVYNFESPLYVLSTWEAQWASKAGLPSSLGFALGGLYSIRGYNNSVVTGDKGWRQQTELHYSGLFYRQSSIEPFVFLDHGETRMPGFHAKLTSAGLGTKVSARWGALEVAAAQTLEPVGVSGNDFRVYVRLSLTGWE
ncbi:ShlB/FhaC/HecB family hemolysin secretion/activation protein [Endozoicomonas sp. 4G]|uniref:ShlB/FhaC/HecB family hemolysin secretion/activation protein n=1 Tax=Endozoicomonas sp. 4G TaxID=2872754 RepID=UPI00207855A8|nr:ShlB/FhaC/HecB family hemolysin secretion/activation protein [Endozoicomonas sp. 4G]